MQKNKLSSPLIYQYVLNESLIIQNILSKEVSDDMFIHLIGESQTQNNWSATSFLDSYVGHLNKLYRYYSLFPAHGQNSLCNIDIALKLTLKTAKECQSALINDLECPLPVLKQMLYNITFIFIQKIEIYAKNQYVLFFLLRKHQQIDTIYGKGTVARIFLALFSKGIVEATQYLLQKFSALGYNHLIPSINKHFNMIRHYES